MIKLGVLASTKATDLQAVIDAISSKKLNAVISVVISDRQDAYALERAKRYNIPDFVVDSKGIKHIFEVKGVKADKEKIREEFDKQIAFYLDKYNVNLILLIGYMRILSQWFVKRYKNKIINIHPSLLPKYAGRMDKDVHAEVLKNREKVTGATLHFVDEGADTGQIILQKEVKIGEDETIDSLKEKVQKAEQEIIIKAVNLFEKGKIKCRNFPLVKK